jgi:hypothetical protein
MPRDGCGPIRSLIPEHIDTMQGEEVVDGQSHDRGPHPSDH